MGERAMLVVLMLMYWVVMAPIDVTGNLNERAI